MLLRLLASIDSAPSRKTSASFMFFVTRFATIVRVAVQPNRPPPQCIGPMVSFHRRSATDVLLPARLPVVFLARGFGNCMFQVFSSVTGSPSSVRAARRYLRTIIQPATKFRIPPRISVISSRMQSPASTPDWNAYSSAGSVSWILYWLIVVDGRCTQPANRTYFQQQLRDFS